MQYLAFKLDGVEYAVDVRIVQNVVEYAGETAVPSRLPYFRGVMDLRGESVPILDLRAKLGLRAGELGSDACVLVFTLPGAGERALVGALVDGVSGVVDLEETTDSDADDAVHGVWEPFVLGISRLDGRAIVRMSPDGLFSSRKIGDALAG